MGGARLGRYVRIGKTVIGTTSGTYKDLTQRNRHVWRETKLLHTYSPKHLFCLFHQADTLSRRTKILGNNLMKSCSNVSIYASSRSSDYHNLIGMLWQE